MHRARLAALTERDPHLARLVGDVLHEYAAVGQDCGDDDAVVVDLCQRTAFDVSRMRDRMREQWPAREGGDARSLCGVERTVCGKLEAKLERPGLRGAEVGRPIIVGQPRQQQCVAAAVDAQPAVAEDEAAGNIIEPPSIAAIGIVCVDCVDGADGGCRGEEGRLWRVFFREAYLSIKGPLTRLDPVHP